MRAIETVFHADAPVGSDLDAPAAHRQIGIQESGRHIVGEIGRVALTMNTKIRPCASWHGQLSIFTRPIMLLFGDVMMSTSSPESSAKVKP